MLGHCLQDALSHTDSTCRLEVKGHGTSFQEFRAGGINAKYASSLETELYQQMNYKSNISS